MIVEVYGPEYCICTSGAIQLCDCQRDCHTSIVNAWEYCISGAVLSCDRHMTVVMHESIVCWGLYYHMTVT